MCHVLQVNRSTYYYEAATKKDESELTADIQEIFRKSRNHYGTRKIKKELVDCGKQVSRRRIGRIMKQEGLISSYTTAQFKPQKDRCNESKVANVLNRQFQNQPYRNVVVSDLTYVRVGNHWNYIWILIDLFNREMDCQHFFRQIFLGYFPDIVQAFDTLGRNVYGDDYTSLHNPIVLSSVLLVYGMFHYTQILF